MVRFPLNGLYIKNRLFLKILAYFLSLLIPIGIIGSIVYFDMERMIENDVSRKLSNNLQASAQSINLHLSMAQSISNNLLNSDIIQRNLKPYSLMSDEDKINMQLITRAIASNQTTFHTFIDNIFLFIDTEKVYTGDGVVNFETFFTKFYRTAEYGPSFWAERLKATHYSDMLGTVVKTDFVQNAKRVIPNITTQYVNGRKAAMVTSLSVQAIDAALVRNAIYGDTAFLITDRNAGRIVDQLGLAEEDFRRIVERFRDSAGDSLFMTVGGVPSVVVHAASDFFGWDYYSITPAAAFSQESRQVLQLLIWICASLIVIGVVFSFIFSVNIYNPIRNIHRILAREGKADGQDDAGETRGDLFRHIDAFIRRLMEQNRAAAAKLNQYSSELLDQFFLRLASGQPPAQSGVYEQIVSGIGFQRGRYVCCGFLFRFKDRFFREIEEGDRLRIQDRLQRVLWGIMQQYVDGYMFERDQNFHVCMVNLKEDRDLEKFRQGLDVIKLTFEYDTMYCGLTIGVGKVYGRIEDLSKSYSEMLTAIGAAGGTAGIRIVDAADLKIEETYYYSFLDEKKIVNLLKAGNMASLEAEVRELVRTNRNRNVSYPYLGALLFDLMNTGIRFLNERSIGKERLLSKEAYEALADKDLSPGDLEDRLALLFEFYGRIIEAAAPKTENKKQETVAAMIARYIEEHYAEDIYLEKIAQEMNLSAKYISRKFREATGTTITDYITSVRMAKAKELLANTDLKVTEIADRVGIPSRTTFLRLFKKSEGFSPTEYRLTRRQDDAAI